MSGHHGHDHSHAVVTEGNSKKLTFALILTSTFLVVEVIAGFMTQSLALLSDAAHMFTDAAALAIALVAIKIGKLPADIRFVPDPDDKSPEHAYRKYVIMLVMKRFVRTLLVRR